MSLHSFTPTHVASAARVRRSCVGCVPRHESGTGSVPVSSDSCTRETRAAVTSNPHVVFASAERAPLCWLLVCSTCWQMTFTRAKLWDALHRCGSVAWASHTIQGPVGMCREDSGMGRGGDRADVFGGSGSPPWVRGEGDLSGSEIRLRFHYARHPED